MDASEGRLSAEVEGDVETEDGVLVIRRIRVRYRLVAATDGAVSRGKIQRAFEAHPRHCPVYRTLAPAIDITTELELVEADG